MGVPTPAGPVPIVVALALYDLAVGDPSVRPGPIEGYAACEAATTGPIPLGLLGAATGATVASPDAGARRPGSLVSVSAAAGDLVVSALVAVNAFGAPGAADSDQPAGSGRLLGNTTIGLVATNAALDKVGCFLVAQSAHDGLARAVFPAHTRFDGDAFVAASVGPVVAGIETVRSLATHVVAAAIRTLA